MLWLVAASGLVAWQATRRRRGRSAAGLSLSQSGVSSDTEYSNSYSRTSLVSQTRSLLAELKDALSCLCGNAAACESIFDVEHANNALVRGEEALPWLCNLLEKPEDTQVLTDVAEILALLSPSRHGLQPAISEAGAVPLLVQLLVVSLWQPHSPEEAATAAPTLSRSDPQSACCSSVSRVRGPHATASDNDYEGHPTRNPLAAAVTAPVLAHVLRALVNLTSSARLGVPVRHAILKSHPAVKALLQLLLVQAEQTGKEMKTAVAGEEDDGTAVLAAGNEGPMPVDGVGCCGSDSGGDQHGGWPLVSRPCVAPAMSWKLAGLAAWLLAHLCSMPAGQIHLVQEGVVPLLIRLVRQGRLSWDGACVAGDICDGEAGRCVAAGSCRPSATDLPYVLAAVQYGLMALVNITYDNSANQRAAAVAGALSELDVLFHTLLKPGLLVEQPRLWHPSQQLQPSPVAAVAVTACPGTRPSVGDDGCGHPPQVVREDEGGEQHGVEGGWRGDEEEVERQAELLRSCSQGVAKFAVWLLAHLSSSDPDLKAAIAGPAYGFLPKLLSFLKLGEHCPRAAAAEEEPAHRAAAHFNDGCTTAHLAQTRGRVPSPSDSQPRSIHVPPPAAYGYGSTAIVAVRQYAAMALVNLTCGVPSTKAAVARVMDWEAMAGLLGWLAEVAMGGVGCGSRAANAAVAGKEAPAAAAGSAAALTSDLLLYTVWLLQHLSLSPVAAVAADPQVVPPLVTLLAAPEPHVRLRAAAALGALCSSPAAPPPSATAVAATALSAPRPSLGEQHPHRVAFLAANGVRRLLEAARAERDPHLLAYDMLCLSSAVGEDDLAAVAEAVAGGALELLEGLLSCDHAACLIPAAEALQGLARAARQGLRGQGARARGSPAAAGAATAAATAAAVVVAGAADHIPRSLLSRVVAVMLTHGDLRVRSAMNDALGALTSLPGVRDRYCLVFAETLSDLVTAAEVELRVMPVN